MAFDGCWLINPGRSNVAEQPESEAVVITLQIDRKAYEFVQSMAERLDKSLGRPKQPVESHCRVILEEAIAVLAHQFMVEAVKSFRLTDAPKVVN